MTVSCGTEVAALMAVMAQQDNNKMTEKSTNVTIN